MGEVVREGGDSQPSLRVECHQIHIDWLSSSQSNMLQEKRVVSVSLLMATWSE